MACAFEVVFEGEQRAAYELREEEFHVVSAPYTTLDGAPAGEGLLCAQWTDEGYREKYGDAVYEERYGKLRRSTNLGLAARLRRDALSRIPAPLRPRGREGRARRVRLVPRRDVAGGSRDDCPTVPGGTPRGHGDAAAARARRRVSG